MSVGMSEGDAAIAARLRMIEELERFLAGAVARNDCRRVIPTKRPTREQISAKSWSWYHPNHNSAGE